MTYHYYYSWFFIFIAASPYDGSVYYNHDMCTGHPIDVRYKRGDIAVVGDRTYTSVYSSMRIPR